MPSRLAMLCMSCLVALSVCSPAYAVGTGDDPTPIDDVLTRGEAKRKARLELLYEAEESAGADLTASEGSVVGLAVDLGAAYTFLYTPSHRQERSYWCGPATCQIIVDYYTSCPAQSSMATALGTTRTGTTFSLVDDVLRKFTGKPYYYYGSLTASAVAAKIEHSIGTHRMPVVADLAIDGSLWPNYVRDYDGHIVPVEAFDWRVDTVRLNDPFAENEWYSYGGYTYGHKTYSRATFTTGVTSHWRRALVCAP